MADYTTVYTCHPSESVAREQGAALGIVFPPSGSVPVGNQRYALESDIGTPWLTPPVYDNGAIAVPGVPDPEGGYWSMLGINQAWEGHAATITAIEALGVRRFPTHPQRVWAGS